VAILAGRLVSKNPPPSIETEEKNIVRKKTGNPALEGAKLVFASPYLVSIIGIVGLYEIVSTVMDFQFTATIEHYLDGPAIGRQFSTVFTITNWVSLIVQFFRIVRFPRPPDSMGRQPAQYR
jgi:AAA family ATP:ADP antiporter